MRERPFAQPNAVSSLIAAYFALPYFTTRHPTAPIFARHE
jgi:hypothetical protein